MIRKKSTRALLLASTLAVIAVTAIGCTKNIIDDHKIFYYPPTSPNNVLRNLQTVYKNRDYDQYAPLLADDFLFYFDPDTRVEKHLPEFWNKLEDSTHTSDVLKSSNVSDVRINLTYQTIPDSVNEVGHERWLKIQVTDTFLEVDLKPEPGQEEGVTLQVDGQVQNFFFRQGKTEGDTLPGSTTAANYYIVQWRDQGRVASASNVPRD